MEVLEFKPAATSVDNDHKAGPHTRARRTSCLTHATTPGP